jgi:hypothetical protein
MELIAKETAVPLRRILICDSDVNAPLLLERFINRLPELLDQASAVTVLHVMSKISAMPNPTESEGEQLQSTAEVLIAGETPEGIILKKRQYRFYLVNLSRFQSAALLIFRKTGTLSKKKLRF